MNAQAFTSQLCISFDTVTQGSGQVVTQFARGYWVGIQANGSSPMIQKHIIGVGFLLRQRYHKLHIMKDNFYHIVGCMLLWEIFCAALIEHVLLV